jgi:hypothetical protein
MWWNMRDLLNPDYGSEICLPDDPEILADLTAPTYEWRPTGVVIEDKKKLIKRLGRSPDAGDAICLAFFGGMSQSMMEWLKRRNKNAPK